MKKLPNKIKVACFDIYIEEWNPVSATANNRYGEFSGIERKIRIDTSFDDIRLADTLMHELLHAIWWAYGIRIEDKEERIIGTLATGMIQVLRDNPPVLKCFKELTQQRNR